MTPQPIPDALPLPESWREDAGRMPAPEVAAVLLAVLRTLGAWHEYGRCHGSLSLADVQRGGNGEIWVLPPAGQAAPQPEQQGYAAFECHGDAAPDSRADVYAVCAIGWTLLTGRRPPSALARAVQGPDALGELDAECLRQPENRALGEVLLQGLAFFPEDRYASVRVLEEAVQASLAASEPETPQDQAAPEAVLLSGAALPVGAPLSIDEILPPIAASDDTASSISPEYAAAAAADLGAKPEENLPTEVSGQYADQLSTAQVSTGLEAEAVAQTEPASAAADESRDDKDKRAPLPLIAAVLLLLLGAGVYWWLNRTPADAQPETAAQAVMQDELQEAPGPGTPASPMADASGQASPALPEASGAQDGMQAQAGAQTQADVQRQADTQARADAQAPASTAQAHEQEGSVASSGDMADASTALPGEAADSASRMSSDGSPRSDAIASNVAAVPDDAATSDAAALDDAASGRNDAEAEPPAPPKPAAVTVNLSITPWAEVYVDGVRRGVSPPMRTLSLAPGSYRIELRNGHDAPRRIQLQVQQGKPASVSHSFE